MVFEAVCGFLNADGGVLYLGVNDQGDPILARDRGLTDRIVILESEDLEELKKEISEFLKKYV